jgi:hypothetical protein
MEIFLSSNSLFLLKNNLSQRKNFYLKARKLVDILVVKKTFLEPQSKKKRIEIEHIKGWKNGTAYKVAKK